jgi:hypothetical protein
MTRVHLDKLLGDQVIEPGQALVIGCPQCGQPNLTIGYANGFLMLACKPCDKSLGAIVVAGAEHQMLAQALDRLAEIQGLLEADE